MIWTAPVVLKPPLPQVLKGSRHQARKASVDPADARRVAAMSIVDEREPLASALEICKRFTLLPTQRRPSPPPVGFQPCSWLRSAPRTLHR